MIGREKARNPGILGIGRFGSGSVASLAVSGSETARGRGWRRCPAGPMCQRKKSRTRLLAVPRREERESAPAAAGLGCGGLLGRRETRGLGLGR